MFSEELLEFKDFTKRYGIRFFEKRKFANFIDTLGLGRHNYVLWKKESWDYYYLKFRDRYAYEGNK